MLKKHHFNELSNKERLEVFFNLRFQDYVLQAMIPGIKIH